MNGVLVDRELLGDALRLTEAFVSLRHVQASVQRNPDVKAELLREVARANELENQLRAALALPAQAAADAAGVQHFALEAGEGVILPAGRLRLTSVQDGVGAFEFTPDAAGVQAEALTLLRAAQSALEPYMRVIPGTGEPGVLNEAAQVAQRISTYLAQEVQG